MTFLGVYSPEFQAYGVISPNIKASCKGLRLSVNCEMVTTRDLREHIICQVGVNLLGY